MKFTLFRLILIQNAIEKNKRGPQTMFVTANNRLKTYSAIEVLITWSLSPQRSVKVHLPCFIKLNRIWAFVQTDWLYTQHNMCKESCFIEKSSISHQS